MSHFLERLLVKAIYAYQGLFKKKDFDCPFCSTRDSAIEFKKGGLIEVRRCRKCFLYWTNPIFDLPDFYDSLYRMESGLTIEGMSERELTRLLETNFRGTKRDYGRTFEFISRRYPEARVMMELGSSWGYFLYQAKQRGFDAAGVEVAARRAEFGRRKLGVEIVPDMDAFLVSKRAFDAILSFHTLEHLGRDIRTVFDQFARLLRPKGILLVEVPRLHFEQGSQAFHGLGAVHPLGFVPEFFTANLPLHGFKNVEAYGSYDLAPADQGDSMLVLAERA